MSDVTADPAPEAADPVPPHTPRNPGSPAAPGPSAPDPAAPRPLGVARTPTGDDGVDRTLARLADADHLPAGGHAAVYEDVHGGLRDALSALDVRPAPPGPPR
ncbi:hypothetical protein [Streptomyces sp. NPDC059092]|uniref:hypothetical protein n=1 Tax=Streptomyces sp. NPDC059092 TaxID=3346725 RepID=UPI00369F6C52